MMRILKYTLLALLWGGVVAYVVYATMLSRKMRSGRKVERLEIVLADSSAQGQLISGPRVREWFRQKGVATVGVPIDKVDLVGIEQLISRNGFVDRVAASVTYSGQLRVAIRQRTPVVRLLTDGFDAYVTELGYLFTSPRSSSLYMPVVTGSYRPPVPIGYEGVVRVQIDADLRKVDERIAKLEKDKYPLYQAERKNDKDKRDLRRMRVSKRWWKLESEASFEKRVEELKQEKQKLRRKYRYRERMIQESIDKLTLQQEAERQKQKKLEKSYADFMKLLTFVEFIEDDGFWRSEVVQVVARTTPSGALEVDLIPRSGRYEVRFGRLERVEEKFDKLLRFYRTGLSSIGWDEFRTIDIRYKDQVVCRR